VHPYETIEDTLIQEVLHEAAKYRLGLTLTVEHLNQWLTFHTRAVAFVEGMLVVHMPLGVEGVKANEFLPRRDCMVNFKVRNYRYFFNATLSEAARWPTEGGKEIDIIAIVVPQSIERLDRRAVVRVDVPSNMPIRACVWSSPDRQPAWTGNVTNFSAGGFQLRTSRTAMDFFEPGDTLLVNVWLSPDAEPLQLEAYYRHGTRDGQMTLLGLEFSPLYRTSQGRQVYQQILNKVDEIRQVTLQTA
jgi:c-di-GMP-binding flagellar brake protein YcgR